MSTSPNAPVLLRVVALHRIAAGDVVSEQQRLRHVDGDRQEAEGGHQLRDLPEGPQRTTYLFIPTPFYFINELQKYEHPMPGSPNQVV